MNSASNPNYSHPWFTSQPATRDVASSHDVRVQSSVSRICGRSRRVSRHAVEIFQEKFYENNEIGIALTCYFEGTAISPRFCQQQHNCFSSLAALPVLAHPEASLETREISATEFSGCTPFLIPNQKLIKHQTKFPQNRLSQIGCKVVADMH